MVERYATNRAVDGYIRGVLSGEILACKWTRLAVQRHVADLSRVGLHDFPYHFDESRAQHTIDFYQYCQHVEGELAGTPFEPLPWEQFVDWVVFGWVDASGARRFAESYCDVTRGAGKSFWAGCKGLYFQVGDREPGAKVYSAATKEDQAAIVWGVAAEVARQSEELSEVLVVYDSVNNRVIKARDSATVIFRPLAADSRTADGLNPHAVINDEVHEHKNRKLYTKLKTAMGKRRQPHIFHITTAGDDRTETLYDELRGHAEEVLEGWADGSFVDERFFAIIYCLDDGDEPYDEALWPKANPSLGAHGSGQKLAHLRDMAARSHQNAEVKRDYLRMHCGIRISLDVKPITKEAWDACGAEIDWSSFDGLPAIGAIDLSSTRDLTAVTLLFHRDGLWYYRFYAWLPRENLLSRIQEDRVPYDRWVEDGWLELTPGTQVDQTVVAARVKELSARHQVVEWTNDPWHAVQLGNVLQEEAGIEVVGFMQDLKSFGEPTMLFLDEVASRAIRHDRNPLARWCAGNLVTREDSNGNKRPHKKASRYRVDPMVTAVMARGRALVHKLASPPPPGPYQDRGLLVLG